MYTVLGKEGVESENEESCFRQRNPEVVTKLPLSVIGERRQDLNLGRRRQVRSQKVDL